MTCDALRTLVPFVQFKKLGKLSWRPFIFNNFAINLRDLRLISLKDKEYKKL